MESKGSDHNVMRHNVSLYLNVNCGSAHASRTRMSNNAQPAGQPLLPRPTQPKQPTTPSNIQLKLQNLPPLSCKLHQQHCFITICVKPSKPTWLVLPQTHHAVPRSLVSPHWQSSPSSLAPLLLHLAVVAAVLKVINQSLSMLLQVQQTQLWHPVMHLQRGQAIGPQAGPLQPLQPS
jgi:hypothetical protein